MKIGDERSGLTPALEFLQGLWQLNHALEALSSRMEKSIGVTAQQRLIVRCVGRYPDISAGELAALLHVDPGTVSVSLKRLEKKALLERSPDPDDKRRTFLRLTKKGRALDAPSEGTVEDAVERLIEEQREHHVTSAKNVVARLTELLGQQMRDGCAVKPARAGKSARRGPSRRSPRG